MTRQTPNIRRMVVAAMIAAVYCAVSLLLLPLSFGAVQVRVSEALTLLPVLSPDAIVGVTLGCALTNALGSSMGLIDVVVGTSATLIAALMSWALRKARVFGLPMASSLPPVLVNAVFIGAEITLLSPEGMEHGRLPGHRAVGRRRPAALLLRARAASRLGAGTQGAGGTAVRKILKDRKKACGCAAGLFPGNGI